MDCESLNGDRLKGHYIHLVAASFMQFTTHLIDNHWLLSNI